MDNIAVYRSIVAGAQLLLAFPERARSAFIVRCGIVVPTYNESVSCARCVSAKPPDLRFPICVLPFGCIVVMFSAAALGRRV